VTSTWIRWTCPSCGSPLDAGAGDSLRCRPEGLCFRRRQGIWELLTEDRTDYFGRFLEEYGAVRRGEGRGATDADYYRHLPFVDRSGKFSADWRLRARSFRFLMRRIVRPATARAGRRLAALDLGAGNCWLSNRLALDGHSVAAVDLSTDDADGLGAHRHYSSSFEPVQAEYDRLPFADSSFDLAVFNGSLHYSTSYESSLAEALRVTSGGGLVVVMETPIYRREASGRQMVREREELFERLYGFRSNALPSENFLTFERLDRLASALAIRWRRHRPFYGLRWALRPLRARLHGDREPARFLFAVAEKPGPPRQAEA
jgi:SAM-dependent methyltransferase